LRVVKWICTDAAFVAWTPPEIVPVCVLDWNTPAVDFYRAHGATPRDEWTVFRLSGSPLHQLAGRR
jgi:hypothetical protein